MKRGIPALLVLPPSFVWPFSALFIGQEVCRDHKLSRLTFFCQIESRTRWPSYIRERIEPGSSDQRAWKRPNTYAHCSLIQIWGLDTPFWSDHLNIYDVSFGLAFSRSLSAARASAAIHRSWINLIKSTWSHVYWTSVHSSFAGKH